MCIYLWGMDVHIVGEFYITTLLRYQTDRQTEVIRVRVKHLHILSDIYSLLHTSQCINLAIWGELGYVALLLVIA